MDLTTQAWETSTEAAIQHSYDSAVYLRDIKNKERIMYYQQNYQDWKIGVLNGSYRPDQNIPIVPRGWELFISERGFFSAELGDSPVCQPIHEDLQDYTHPIGNTTLEEPEDLKQAPKNDPFPIGYVITDEDGNKWKKEKRVSPFGVVYVYVKLAATDVDKVKAPDTVKVQDGANRITTALDRINSGALVGKTNAVDEQAQTAVFPHKLAKKKKVY